MAYRKTLMLPVSPNDLPAVQGWLQGLAVQGLLLEACDNGTFVFQKKDSTQRRYRIDPSKGNTMGVATPKLMDLYREFGWYYVDSYDRYHHVFYTDDPEAVEPFVSPEALAESLDQLKHRKLFVLIPVMLIYLVCTVWIWTIPSRPLFNKVLDGLVFISVSWRVYHELKPLMKVKDQVSDGTLLKNRYPHQMEREIFWRRTFSRVLIVLLFIQLFFTFRH